MKKLSFGLNIEKVKYHSETKGLGSHFERTAKDYDNKLIDKSKSHLNMTYGTYANWHQEATKIANGKKIRGDSVGLIQGVITFPKELLPYFPNEKIAMDHWAKFMHDHYFSKSKIGKLNSYQLHMDESTPHIHFQMIPILENGNLGAKHINPELLQLEQDRLNELGNQMLQSSKLNNEFVFEKLTKEERKEKRFGIEDNIPISQFKVLMEEKNALLMQVQELEQREHSLNARESKVNELESKNKHNKKVIDKMHNNLKDMDIYEAFEKQRKALYDIDKLLIAAPSVKAKLSPNTQKQLNIAKDWFSDDKEVQALNIDDDVLKMK